jgi:small subunit ribosomal protein S10
MLQIHDKKLILKVKSFQPYYINMFLVRFTEQLKQMAGASIEQTFLPRRYERVTLLKSPHADKKAREQFERVTHKRIFTISMPEPLSQANAYAQVDKIFSLAQTLAVGLVIELQTVSTKKNAKN